MPKTGQMENPAIWLNSGVFFCGRLRTFENHSEVPVKISTEVDRMTTVIRQNRRRRYEAPVRFSTSFRILRYGPRCNCQIGFPGNERVGGFSGASASANTCRAALNQGSCVVFHPPPTALIRTTLASVRRRIMSISFRSLFKAAVCHVITCR
jgi:hypothetical protein